MSGVENEKSISGNIPKTACADDQFEDYSIHLDVHMNVGVSSDNDKRSRFASRVFTRYWRNGKTILCGLS